MERGGGEGGETVSVLRRSPYQKIVLTQTSGGLTRLYLNGQQQFESGVPERLYHEGLVHPAMTMAGGRRNILVLGGGDGLALREILKYPEVQRVTLVDIDRQMIDLSSRFPVMQALNRASFMDPRAHGAVEDAFMFVMHAAGRAQ